MSNEVRRETTDARLLHQPAGDLLPQVSRQTIAIVFRWRPVVAEAKAEGRGKPRPYGHNSIKGEAGLAPT